MSETGSEPSAKKRVADRQLRRDDEEEENEENEDGEGFSVASEEVIAQRKKVKVRRRGGAAPIPEDFTPQEQPIAVPSFPSLATAPVPSNGTAEKKNEEKKEETKTDEAKKEETKTEEVKKDESKAETSAESSEAPKVEAKFNFGSFNWNPTPDASLFKPTEGAVSFASVSSTNPNSIFSFDMTKSTEPSSAPEAPPLDFSQPKVDLPPAAEVKTGEEGEKTVFTTKAKLYEFVVAEKAFKERGVGPFKVNIAEDGETTYARILMRVEGTGRVILNNKISAMTKAEAHTQPKQVRLTGFTNVETGAPTQYVLRVDRPDTADELCKAVAAQKPAEDATSPAKKE